jgi:hypothetical protein
MCGNINSNCIHPYYDKKECPLFIAPYIDHEIKKEPVKGNLFPLHTIQGSWSTDDG